MSRRRRQVMRAADAERISIDEIWQRDHGICSICGLAVDDELVAPDPMSKSIDHVLAIINGGRHTMANVALAHLRCNIRKKAKVLDAASGATAPR